MASLPFSGAEAVLSAHSPHSRVGLVNPSFLIARVDGSLKDVMTDDVAVSGEEGSLGRRFATVMNTNPDMKGGRYLSMRNQSLH